MPCDERHPFFKDLCRCQFSTKHGLEKHKENGDHIFKGGRNLLDTAVQMSSLENGVLAFGNRSNRSEAFGGYQAEDGIGQCSDWDAPGSYRKPGSAPPKRLTVLNN